MPPQARAHARQSVMQHEPSGAELSMGSGLGAPARKSRQATSLAQQLFMAVAGSARTTTVKAAKARIRASFMRLM